MKSDNLDKIQIGLRTRLIGKEILCYDTVASTNDLAWDMARKGAVEGVTIFAEDQTQGRGRMGRSWHSPKGTSLLMSIILRPEIPSQNSFLLTVCSSVAIADAVRNELRLPALIKWPNDIIIREKKVSGILVEAKKTPSGQFAFVLGIGVNVNTTQHQFPPEIHSTATSLAIEKGEKIDRTQFAGSLLKSLDKRYRDLLGGDIDPISERWKELSSTLGKRIIIEKDGDDYAGTLIDMSATEGLTLRLDGGPIRVFDGRYITLKE